MVEKQGCVVSMEKAIAATEENLPGHELIGLYAEVSRSTDPSRTGTKGRVVDETKNTLVLESGGAEKVVPKKEVWLRFKLAGRHVDVKGSALLARPEDRTKNWWRKRHGRVQ